MKYARDITTIEEMLSVDVETMESIILATGYDFQPGDFFYIKGDPTKTYFIEDVKRVSGVDFLIFSGDKEIKYKDAFPQFSAGTLIEILSYFNPLDLRMFSYGWLLIFDNQEIYTSEEDELLVSFLWRVLKDLVAKQRI